MISIDEVFEENEKHQYVTDKIIDDDLGKEIWVDGALYEGNYADGKEEHSYV